MRLTSDVSAVKMLTQVSLRIGTRAPLLMVGSFILMVTTSPRLALAMVPLLLVTSLLIAAFVGRMEPLFFRRVQQRLDAVNTVLQENIAGARLVKALVRADHEARRFDVANEAMTARSVEVMQFMSLMTPVSTMCIHVGVVTVIWSAGRSRSAGR